MRWIGQHIWSFISRFRSDVYLEAVESGTIASGGNLGLDSNNKIVKAAEVGSSVDLTSEVAGVLPVANGGTGTSSLTDNSLLTGTGTSAVTAETNLTYNGSILEITSSTSSEPVFKISNTNADAEGPVMQFFKNSSSPAVDDELGHIQFIGDDSGGAAGVFAEIIGYVQDKDDGNEEGKLTLKVASHDLEMQPGLSIFSGNAEDEVDVTIGNGATSLTTIAGTLTMGSTAFVNNSGVIQVAAQGTIDHNSLANHSAAEHYNWSSDISGTATIHTNNITDLHGAGVDGAAYNLLSDAGDGSITSNSTFRYNTALGIQKLELGGSNGIPFTIHTADHDNGAGADLTIEAGDAAHGGSTDSAGGDLIFKSGQPTGSGAFGNFQFYAGDTEGTGTDARSNSIIAKLEGNAATSTDFTLYEKAGNSTDDFFKISVAAHGATTITTTDNSGVNGNLGLTPDGQLNLGSSISKINTTFDFHANTFETMYSAGHYSGKVIRYSPSGDITATAGAVYYLRTTGAWNLADADAAETSTGLLAVGLGGSTQTFGLLLSGFIRVPYTEILNVPGSGAVDGAPVYLGTESGHFDFTAPSGSSDIVRILGYAIDDHDDSGNTDVLIYFDPDKSWIEIA